MNKCVKFNNKTEVNGEYLNTMVKKAVTAALKEKKMHLHGRNGHQQI